MVAGVLLMRRAAAGYVLALLTLPLAVLIGPVVIGQTVVQRSDSPRRPGQVRPDNPTTQHATSSPPDDAR